MIGGGIRCGCNLEVITNIAALNQVKLRFIENKKGVQNLSRGGAFAPPSLFLEALFRTALPRNTHLTIDKGVHR